jgi:uncharacterized protein YkwD
MKKTNKRPPSRVHKSKQHIRNLHHARIGLFSVLLLALVIVRGDAGTIQASPRQYAQGNVLAYSTSMSRSDLLNATNAFRSQNGLAPLSLNGQLNNSAQNKAQHMVDNNYWAHNAPDGTTPWYFFDQAGYNYTKAGENLAYGFNTSQDAVNGWIGSPGHRANMLGEYYDVGFGFVDGPNYQGGPNTVVVAHYGATAAPAPPAPAPVAQATTPAPTSNPAPTSSAAPTPVAPTPTPTEQPSPEPDQTKTPASQKPSKPASIPEVTVASTAKVTLLDQFKIGQPRFAAIMSLLLVMSVVVGFVLTHKSFVRHAAIVGERYVITHPLVDTTVIAATIVLVLSTTVGRLG